MGSQAVSSNQTLLKYIKRCLLPIARLCIKRSIKLQEVNELLKMVFVEAAHDQLGAEASASRVSVVSGVHRKDVTRILKDREGFRPRPNFLSRIIVQWRHHPSFIAKDGTPKPLEATGRHSEFSRLVESVNGGNLNAYSVLYEMERIGVVERKGNTVKLIWRDYVVERDTDDAYRLLADDYSDLYAAVTDNIQEPGSARNLHLRTVFDAVPVSFMGEIRSWLLEQGSLFHQRVRKYLSKYDTDLNPKLDKGAPKARVVLAAYSFSEALTNDAYT